MEKDVRRYVTSCDSCQRQKPRTQHSEGLLRPLDIPQTRWSDIAMDFADMPATPTGLDSIFVFINRLSKRVHLIPTRKSADTPEVARLFIDNVFKLHGLPRTIVSDRDAKFTSKFWTELMKQLGCEGLMSTARHQQTDGQSERAIITTG